MSDYISREAAVKIAQKYGLANGSALGRHTGVADCIAIEIDGLPAADVEPVRRGRFESGEKQYVEEFGWFRWFRCSTANGLDGSCGRTSLQRCRMKILPISAGI